LADVPTAAPTTTRTAKKTSALTELIMMTHSPVQKRSKIFKSLIIT
jgi:hypothetical protein